MNTRFMTTFLILAVAFVLAACQSEKDRIASLCGEIKAAAAMTDDCDKMAKKLAPLKEKFVAETKKLETAPPDSERASLIEAMSVCARGYLEISTGTCASHEGVRKATIIDD